jgi:hypothetical protein
MSTGVTATFSAGILHVEGTERADQIFVLPVNGRIEVADQYVNQLVKINGNTTSVAANQVKRVEVFAKGGDDLICLNTTGYGAITVPTYLDGGHGNDTFIGGSGFNTYHEADFAPVLHGTQPTDIHQELSPTCQTLASLAEAAAQRQNLAASIHSIGANTYTVQLTGAGTQTVKFDGTWTDNDPTPVADGGVREFWPVLFQRARLQSLGVSYSGPKTQADWDADQARTHNRLYDPADALRTFTGRNVTHSAVSQASPQMLQAALSHGDDLVLGSLPGNKKKDLTPDGIAHNHAYAVLAVYQQGGRWLVDLYNPWGSDAGPVAKRKIGPPGSRGAQADDGIITVDWATVQRNFIDLYNARRP